MKSPIDNPTIKKPKSPLRMLLLSIAPVLAFIFVEEYYGPTAGVIAGMTAGIGETIWIYIKDKKLDGFSLGSTVLILIMGALSLATGNEVFFKLKPALINVMMILVLAISAMMNKPILMMFAKKQLGEDFSSNPVQLSYFRGVSWRICILFLIHTILIVYSAFRMSSVAWAFITKGGSFILMGIFLVFELVYTKYILPKRIKSRF